MKRDNLVPWKGSGEREPWELGWGRDQQRLIFFSSKVDIYLLPFIADGLLELFCGN